MIDTYKRLLALFPRDERRQLPFIAVAILLMAVLQVVGIGSVMPFLAVVADPTVIEQKQWLKWAYDAFGFHRTASFLLMLGCLSFLVLLIANVASALITWWMVRFAESRTHYLASVLLERYLSRPYVFFLQKNSAELGVKVLSEVVQIVSGILLPGLQMLAQSAMAFLLVLFLFTIDPRLSIVVFFGLGGVYFGIYRMVRGRLATIGAIRAEANATQFRALLEASGAIKEIKFLNLEQVFFRRFKAPNLAIARVVASQSVLALIPSYGMETIAFGGILLVVLYMLSTGQNVAEVLPLVGLYAYAILRIKPALQGAYVSLSQIRFNRPALDHVYQDLRSDADVAAFQSYRAQPRGPTIKLRETIELRGVTFRYPGSAGPLFQSFNLCIQAGKATAFVGPTGSGKTTLVDIIVGLLDPDEGTLSVDGSGITAGNRREWQAGINYVPQHIYLSDDTIRNNIAFGVDAELIDPAAVERAAQTAGIHDFIVNHLPLGYETPIGERGVRLSGGQRQRIGIARALYRDAEVLILDEATNALDGITERRVFESVKGTYKAKTVIVVAHRVSTVRDCDTIFLLDKGEIVAAGSYDELVTDSEQFRAMAHLSPLQPPVEFHNEDPATPSSGMTVPRES